MAKSGIDVQVTGPLAREGSRILLNLTAKFITRMLELGEQRLHDQLTPDPKGVFKSLQAAGAQASKGQYRQSVKAYPKGTRGQIHDGGSSYGPWLESGKSRHATTFRGYHTFRKTAQWMQEEVPTEAKKYVRMVVRKMNGV
jgi:hypothetical protein